MFYRPEIISHCKDLDSSMFMVIFLSMFKMSGLYENIVSSPVQCAVVFPEFRT